jgi:glycosyltransferase involved in cell wall biosynthesis
MNVAFWVPDPDSRAAPERCFRWTAEALTDREDVDLLVGSPDDCDWDVRSTDVSTPSRLAAAHDADVIHWTKLMDRTIPESVPATTVLTYHGNENWVCPRLNYGDHPILRSIKEAFVDIGKIWQYDQVCFISHSVRRSVESRLGPLVPRSHVVHNGVNDRFRENVSADVADDYGIDEPYVLHLSAFSRRKNPDRLIDALRRVESRTDMQPVIAGQGWDTPWSIGWVNEEHVPGLLAGAEAFVYPSLQEGFGLPPLEALACGTVPVVSHAFSLPEVIGNRGVYCDPYDADDIFDAITRAVGTEATATDVRRWDAVASELLEVYRDAA